MHLLEKPSHGSCAERDQRTRAIIFTPGEYRRGHRGEAAGRGSGTGPVSGRRGAERSGEGGRGAERRGAAWCGRAGCRDTSSPAAVRAAPGPRGGAAVPVASLRSLWGPGGLLGTETQPTVAAGGTAHPCPYRNMSASVARHGEGFSAKTLSNDGKQTE